ncbi:MAG: JDVT-CTERM domain-containing protein, partial [Zetaproteobacteria bacterium]|nr:JDVT-CTERM domain-containing protein [Zetaproteobacteria bacterium]
QISNTPSNLESIIWDGALPPPGGGPTQYVAVGAAGTIVTSFDALTWTPQAPVSVQNLHDIAWSGSTYLAVGDAGTFITSSDAITWTPIVIIGANTSLQGAMWNGLQFTVIGFDTLTDPVTNNINHENVAFTNSSPLGDFANWKQWVPSVTPTQWLDITWNGTDFIAVGRSGSIWSSPSGQVWTEHSPGLLPQWHDIAWAQNQYIAVGQQTINDAALGITTFAHIAISPDAITWTEQTAGQARTTSNGQIAVPTLRGRLNSIASNNAKFVTVGFDTDMNTAAVLTSPDGITWTQQPSASLEEWFGITWDGAQYIAVGSMGVTITSSDGITWWETPQANRITTNTLRSVAYGALTGGAKAYVAIGDAGTVLTSSDAITWSAQTIVGVTNLIDLLWDGNNFWAIDSAGSLISSADGLIWISQNPGLINPKAIAFSGVQLLVESDRFSGIDSQDKGITWNTHAAIAPFINAITSNGSEFVAVGNDGAIIRAVADADGDTVPDAADAFPLDPAASIDSDGDGFPDSWNVGSSAANSTTIPALALDLYPTNAAMWFDTTAPIITPPANITVAAIDFTGTPASDATIGAFLTGATAIDDIDGNIAQFAHNAPVQFPLGTTTVTFTATDNAGNTGSATANITVTTPTITAPLAVTANTNTTIEISAPGATLSSVSVATGTPPVAYLTPYGVISYSVTIPTPGGSQTMRLTFSTPLPTGFTLHKVDSTGKIYTPIAQGSGANQWQLVAGSNNSIDLTLTDGGPFDLDKTANGTIVDPIAITTPSGKSASLVPPSSGGGGGCAINQQGKFDPTFMFLLIGALYYLSTKRRRHTR